MTFQVIQLVSQKHSIKTEHCNQHKETIDCTTVVLYTALFYQVVPNELAIEFL